MIKTIGTIVVLAAAAVAVGFGVSREAHTLEAPPLIVPLPPLPEPAAPALVKPMAADREVTPLDYDLFYGRIKQDLLADPDLLRVINGKAAYYVKCNNGKIKNC